MIRAGELAPASALVPHQLHAPMRADIVKCADFPIFAARNNRGDRKDVDGLGEPVSGRRDFLDAPHIEPTAAEHFLPTFEALCGRDRKSSGEGKRWEDWLDHWGRANH